MKRTLSLIFSFLGWFALIVQYYLMLKNSVFPFWETTIRYFSFFTILTNLIVALYFTFQAIKNPLSKPIKPGVLTAITIYIVIVGMIYQIILRSTWNPTGLQKIVDELLHTIIPVLVVIFWYLYEKKETLSYNLIPKWAVYPLLYLFYILIRGSFSNFYPYPFVNVTELGLSKVFTNAFWILIFFLGLSMLFIRIGKALKR